MADGKSISPVQLTSLTLALTAYNEESNLEPTVQKALEFLPAAAERWELLIIDDGSADRTRGIAETLAKRNPGVRVIQHPRNLGMGAAIRTAIREAKMETFCTIAADGQVDPRDLKAFVEPATSGTTVFSIYSIRHDGWDRKLLTGGLRLLLLLTAGVWNVPTGNYFVRTEMLQSFPLRGDSFVVNFEVYLETRARKVPIAWVQIPCAPRRSGSSKIRNLRTIWNVARELLRYRLVP